MKSLMISFLVFSGAYAGAVPLYCSSPDSIISVQVSDNQKRATIDADGTTLKYGELRCQPIDETLLECRSLSNALDRGYVVEIKRFPGTWKMRATISIKSEAGLSEFAVLPCVFPAI